MILKTAVESYLRAKDLSRGTRNESLSTLRKWERASDGECSCCRRRFADAR
jgi:hypothetical protein